MDPKGYKWLASVLFLQLQLKMAPINSCKLPGFDCSLWSTPNAEAKFNVSASSLHFLKFSGPNFVARPKSFTFRGLSISYCNSKAMKQCPVVPRVSCLLEDSHEETEASSDSNNSQQEATIDLKLPRRSLLVTFTCDACGSRSQRLINRLAYERGLVYVQCAGCSQYHKLVDNLGLVVEYNLQEETDLDAGIDQV